MLATLRSRCVGPDGVLSGNRLPPSAKACSQSRLTIAPGMKHRRGWDWLQEHVPPGITRNFEGARNSPKPCSLQFCFGVSDLESSVFGFWVSEIGGCGLGSCGSGGCGPGLGDSVEGQARLATEHPSTFAQLRQHTNSEPNTACSREQHQPQ